MYRARELESLTWLEHGFGTRLAGSWTPGPPVWVRQIHSAKCVPAEGVYGCLGQADALISNTPGVYLTIRTADCVPVLLADVNRRTVAAVHAGWRGTVQVIVQAAVRALEERYGSRAEDLVAAIGPGICKNCYEVGPEVAVQFEKWFPERTDLKARTNLDLVEANRRQLVEAGLDPSRIFTGAPCTSCSPQEFHSWRRDHVKTGRMVAAVAIR